jgi:hypothetical protein
MKNNNILTPSLSLLSTKLLTHNPWGGELSPPQGEMIEEEVEVKMTCLISSHLIFYL